MLMTLKLIVPNQSSIKRMLFAATALLLAGTPSWVSAQLLPNLGGQRVGISSFTFLKNDISPRSMALGGASIAMTGDAYAATVNPALASEVRQIAIGASNLWYAGGIQHNHISANVPMGHAGTITATYQMLNLANQDVRTTFAPNGNGQTYSAYSLATSVGYSRMLSQFFSVGIELKYMHEKLAQYRAGAIAADIGFLYRTDWRNLRFAAALQNFGANSTATGQNKTDPFGQGTTTEGYPAPTLFKMGAQLDAVHSGEHLLTTSIQLNHPNDNAENIRVGAEYTYGGMISLRAGVKVNVANEKVPSAGLGFKHNFGSTELNLSYATFTSRYLGWYHQLGLAIYLPDKPKQATPEPSPL